MSNLESGFRSLLGIREARVGGSTTVDLDVVLSWDVVGMLQTGAF